MIEAQEYKRFLKETGSRPALCNCGDAERGHSPDCDYIRSADDMWEEYLDWKWEQQNDTNQ